MQIQSQQFDDRDNLPKFTPVAHIVNYMFKYSIYIIYLAILTITIYSGLSGLLYNKPLGKVAPPGCVIARGRHPHEGFTAWWCQFHHEGFASLVGLVML